MIDSKVLTNEELLVAFAEADALAQSGGWPYVDGFEHRFRHRKADTLRSECKARNLDWESVAAPKNTKVMNPYGHPPR